MPVSIARKGKTDNRACRPFVDLRAESELSLIPFVSAAGGIREIDVGDHALVEQKEIRSHAMLRPPALQTTSFSPPSPSGRQCGNPSDDPGTALHRSEQLQSLGQIGRDQKVRQHGARPKPVLPRCSVENGRHRCPRFDQLRRKEIEKRTRSRDHDLSARDEARCLQGNLGGPAVMTPGRVQPGIGKGRSKAPVASTTCLARMRRATPFDESPTSWPMISSSIPCQGCMLQAVVAGAYSASERKKCLGDAPPAPVVLSQTLTDLPAAPG